MLAGPALATRPAEVAVGWTVVRLRPMRRRWLWALGTVALILIIIGSAGFLWLNDLLDPMPETDAALVSDESVEVATAPWLSFTPVEPSGTGFIFYPGGRVSPEAYAPPLRAIAEAGHLAVAVPMPFGLAVLSPDAADAVIDAHPEIEDWVIGGHSLGGAMAAQYAAGHDAIDALALWAAYPPDGVDLVDDALLVSSVYGSKDGVTTVEEIEASRAQLPRATTFAEIDGGNHAQFGWYGEQDGDGQATISREAQQEQAVAATLELIEAVSR